MAKTSKNYSVLVGVELDTSDIRKQLQTVSKQYKVNLDASEGTKSIKGLNEAMEDTNLTFQAANEVFRTSIEILGSMVEQVFELDSALTEFKKVSDLSGTSLDNYVAKLNEMGASVARTGKPKCQAPNVRMVN